MQVLQYSFIGGLLLWQAEGFHLNRQEGKPYSMKSLFPAQDSLVSSLTKYLEV